jgi:2-(1,2-epoxy-1,2-dihydrophenyl)acetyl-CoA isomerase
MNDQATLKSYREEVEHLGPVPPFQFVQCDVHDGVALITMKDPASLNAFSGRMTLELRTAIKQCSIAADVSAIVLTGAGIAFSAGGDIRKMEDTKLTPAERYEFIRHEFGGVIKSITDTDKPVIAAVNGHAMGVGFFTALSCDMIIASEQARFGTAYIKLALTPLGVSFIMARALGYVRAYELCALGGELSAKELLDCRLINRVCNPSDLLVEAKALAQRLAKGPARALGFTKQILRQAAYADLEQHLMLGEAIQPLCLASDDHKEAVKAFAEKRKPTFTGL